MKLGYALLASEPVHLSKLGGTARTIDRVFTEGQSRILTTGGKAELNNLKDY
jgi:hypothetical protein